MEYTSEQLNYFRLCYITFNLIPEGLRKIFKQEWDFLYKSTPPGEWKDTPQNGLDFYSRETRRKRPRNARYLSTVKNGNTTEWDCTCLFFAILYSDSIGTTLGLAVQKDVDDLRQFRNDIAHINEAELTDADFQKRVGDVIATFSSLKLPVKDIVEVQTQKSFLTAEVVNLRRQVANLDNLKNELLQAKSDLQLAQSTIQKTEEQVEALTQEVNSRVESFYNLAFKPSHEVIERSNDVTRIMKKMQELEDRSNGARISTIYLSGIPGCGKSQIARQIGREVFEKRSHESESLTFVATLNAETLKALAESYMNLARQLGVTEYTLTNLDTLKEDSPKEKIQRLKRLILPRMKQFSNWLIIVDNVVDLSLVRSDLPPTASKEWGHGQVLITTQDSSSIPCNAPHTFHESLSEGMQPGDAVKLLMEVSQIPNQEEVESVAEVLEYQPLALAAAAFYVQTVVSNGSPSYGWASYLKTLDDGRREATEEFLAAENLAYSTSMSTAIKIAIKRASESDDVLCEVFSFLSLCSNDSLPIEAVVDFVKERTMGKTEESIRAKILKYSWLTSFDDEDRVPCYVRVHNIVHEVLKTSSTSGFVLTKKAQCISAAIKTLYSLIEEERKLLRGSSLACEKLRKISSHCKALREILLLPNNVEVKDVLLNELTHSVTPGNMVSWFCSTAHVCCDLSDPSTAIVFSKSAFQSVKYISSSPEGDLLKAEVCYVRGKVLELQSKSFLAISKYKEAMKIYEAYQAIHGEVHAEIAKMCEALGNLYIGLERYKRAKEYHEKALVIRSKIYDANHPDIGTSYNSLGLVSSNLGENYKEQVKEYYEKALCIAREIYGEEHINVAAGYNNLGVFYSDKGQHSQAKTFHEKALIIGRKIYGEDHPEVATTYFNLAFDYRMFGQHNEAKECDLKALMIRKKIHGEEHPDVAESYDSLVIDYRELGQHNEATKCDEKARIVRQMIYGEDHSDGASSYYSVRVKYLRTGQQNDTKECKRVPSVKNLTYNSNFHCWKPGKHNQEKEFDEKVAMSAKDHIHGEMHPAVAESQTNLIACGHNSFGVDANLTNSGEKGGPKEWKEKTPTTRKNYYSQEHHDEGKRYHDMGAHYRKIGQYNQAKQCDEKALKIRMEFHGEEHPEVARSYESLSLDYTGLGQHNEAKEYDERALIIRSKLYDDEHPDVATSYFNLGFDYRKLGLHSKAKECDEKALFIRRQTYGEEHLDVARSSVNLGIDCWELGQYNRAKELDLKALIIRESICSEDDPDLAKSYHNLGVDNRKLGQHNEAKECDEKALTIGIRIYGEEHPDVAKSYQNLALDFVNLGKYKEAKECLKRALIIRTKIYGKRHPDVVQTFHSLNLVKRHATENNQTSRGQCIVL